MESQPPKQCIHIVALVALLGAVKHELGTVNCLLCQGYGFFHLILRILTIVSAITREIHHHPMALTPMILWHFPHQWQTPYFYKQQKHVSFSHGSDSEESGASNGWTLRRRTVRTISECRPPLSGLRGLRRTCCLRLAPLRLQHSSKVKSVQNMFVFVNLNCRNSPLGLFIWP